MSSVLVVSPEYVSHYYPLSAVGRELVRRGHQVVVASGLGLCRQVEDDGMSHMELKLGPGSNPGVMRASEQSESERQQIEAFFAATRKGMVPTLLHQAMHRSNDLMWQPARVREGLREMLDVVEPDVVIADHLAFGATAGLRALDVPYLSFHPGHPSALATDVPFGVPARVPAGFRVAEDEWFDLNQTCSDVSDRFRVAYNDAIDRPGGDDVNPFVAAGPLGLLVNYPGSLGLRYDITTAARLTGSSVRRFDAAAFAPSRGTYPRILISLGTFFSARSDLLRKLVTAFRNEPVEVMLAHGSTPIEELGFLPGHWTVAEFLPQPELLDSCSLVVTHGGNNTVTEALTAGVPLLVGPLSTDQFSAAADIEDASLGAVFDPNNDSSEMIADLAHTVISGGAPGNAAAMGEALRSNPGHELAADLVEELIGGRPIAA